MKGLPEYAANLRTHVTVGHDTVVREKDLKEVRPRSVQQSCYS